MVCVSVPVCISAEGIIYSFAKIALSAVLHYGWFAVSLYYLHCAGLVAVKVKAISAYHGLPAPPNGLPCLTFEANSIVTLLSDEDSTWWQVNELIAQK